MQGTLFDLGLDFEEVVGGAGAGVSSIPALSLLARSYQLGWQRSVRDAWLSGRRRLCGVAATGTGKTVGIALFIRDVLDGVYDHFGRERRVLVIARRKFLVEQLAKELGLFLPDAAIEMEMGQERARSTAQVVVCCLESLAIPRRLEWFRPWRYTAMMWDESHRYGIMNKAVQRVLRHFGEEMLHVGLTATPDRTDRLSAFSDVVFNFDILTAVQEGYLVKPHLAYEFCGDIRLDQLKLTKGGEFDQEELSDLMSSARPVAALVSAARKWSLYGGGRRQTIVTCASIKHAELVATLLNEWHGKDGSGLARPIHSRLDPRDSQEHLDGFKSGKYQYLTHFDQLTEGVDVDVAKVMVNGRPLRKSRRVFVQCAGRVLRPVRDVAKLLGSEPLAERRREMILKSSKPGAVIVDVAGTNHRLSLDLLDVFASYDGDESLIDCVRKKTVETSAKSGKFSDVVAEIEKQRAENAKLAKERREHEQGRYSGLLVSAQLSTKMEDPFTQAASSGNREPPWLMGKKPTLNMQAVLLKSGIPEREVKSYTFTQAKNVIDLIIKRSKDGLSSYKQIALLRRFGVDGVLMTFEEASAAIDGIAKNNWRAVS